MCITQRSKWFFERIWILVVVYNIFVIFYHMNIFNLSLLPLQSRSCFHLILWKIGWILRDHWDLIGVLVPFVILSHCCFTTIFLPVLVLQLFKHFLSAVNLKYSMKIPSRWQWNIHLLHDRLQQKSCFSPLFWMKWHPVRKCEDSERSSQQTKEEAANTFRMCVWDSSIWGMLDRY